MRRNVLEFSYEMRSEFDRDITGHDFRLMCLPSDSLRQRVLDMRYEISPCTWLSRGRDGFGNEYLYGAAKDSHDRFAVEVRGTVETGLFDFEAEAGLLAEMFRYPTTVTAPGRYAAEFLRSCTPGEAPDAYGTAVRLMGFIYEGFTYRTGVSDTTTTSEQAFACRQGVCQDYAHALVTLCRMEGIPARYVAGMLFGEGETHAWTEILCGGRWYGLDPTHNRPVGGGYISLSRGRDCRDCLVNRGIYFHSARETQKICVNVGIKGEDE